MKKCLIMAVLLQATAAHAQIKTIAVPKPGMAFQPAIQVEDIDPAVYAQWVDGVEKPVQVKGEKPKEPQGILWTAQTEISYGGITYGASKKTGPRHLRFGFHAAISIGTLLADGGGRPSLLKPGAPYPGNLNDESQWIPAQRLINGQLSGKEACRMDYVLWVFPPGTKTRAIRFSHQPEPSDEVYEGWLGGVLVTEERYANLAPDAVVASKTANLRAGLLTNGVSDDWTSWATKDGKGQATVIVPVITKENPEWILLTWSQPVALKGLLALWAGFSTAEVQAYTGAVSLHPRDAGENQWQTIGAYEQVMPAHGRLWPNTFDFGKVITTRAIRLKLTGAVKEGGGKNQKPLDLNRVWLGELMALQPLDASPLQASRTTAQERQAIKPPIAIPFTLKEAGYVTLVIEDKNGIRVRNLVSETWFNAGKNTAWWDGLDDLGRDIEASRHGVYKIPAKFVAPGEYKVRGLVRGEIKTSYEFSVYTTGTPPWPTDDHTGAWLANHSAPQSAVFVPAQQSPTGEPAVYLGAFVTEGPDGLAWVDLDGKKLGGKKWVGGAWTAAPYIARDAGSTAATDVYAYVAAVWETGKQSGEGELRITGLTAKADKPIILHPTGALPPKADKGAEIGGFAVQDRIAVVSLTKKNELIFVDVNAGKVLGTTPVDAPRGLAFDAGGGLLVLSGNRLLRFPSIQPVDHLPASQTMISTGLEAPVAITLDTEGKLYISDGGQSHQVKVFSAEGRPLRTIGKPGVPAAGPYDELHMNNPSGITIDSRQQLWVAENDYLPKRVSVWSLDGKFIKAFYGPAKYGGGGSLDPQDKTKFYYADETKGSMEFALDWKTGESKLKQVLYRQVPGSLPLAFRSASPETVLYYKGRRYFTNCYNSSPTSGHSTAFLFVERNGIACPAVAMGKADAWDLLKEDRFKTVLPEGVDLKAKDQKADAFFIWTDLNGDAQVQTEEVAFEKGVAGGITIMEDLSFCLSQDGRAMQFAPVEVTAQGVPHYQLGKSKLLAEGVQPSASSGGNQILAAPGGWTVAIQGILPFNRYSICGAKDGKCVWSYPDLWPGLHASHEAPLPDFPGQLIGPTRLLGGLMELKGADSGPLWAVNSNHGMIYIFTSDGLFVATLFEPMRTGKRWRMPVAERGMSLAGITLGEENFWPTITQTKEGEVYIVDGARSSLIKVDGLKNISRVPVSSIRVSAGDLEKSRKFLAKAEALRQKSEGRGILPVLIRAVPIVVDGKLDDWIGAEWVDIDKSGVKANFNSDSKPYDVTGAVAVSGDRLYIGYHTGDAALLKNSGEMPTAPFKTGGALDLMLGTDPASKADRKTPVAGDLRLLVTVIKGKPYALLYRAVVAGTKQGNKVPFASPWRTISFDRVDDVSKEISFAAGKAGDYEISVPLAVLQLVPKAGMHLKGDIGILRGDGTQTISRAYWSNKAAGIVSDVPAEAELTPALWGSWEFR